MQRSLLSACLPSLLCVALGCSAGTRQDADRASAPQPEASQAATADADVAITQATVYENERYWPAIVALTKEWLPPGETKPLKTQYRGTLVRVEADGRVRIDFGRHGRHETPMDHTDLVQRANEVRLGTRTKLAPNFVLRVGNSLVDSSSRPLRPHSLDKIAGASGYLCIFADPRAANFPILAQQLAALEGVNGVRAVFFPQSVVRDDLEFVHERLETLSWHVAFMYPQLSGSYTLSLLGEVPERPRALLISPEGRVLHQAELGTAAGFSELRQAVESVQPPASKSVERADDQVGEQKPPG
jgi:hypothetical protein